MTNLTKEPTQDEKMQKLIKEKDLARSYQERRHDAWDENYDLFRGVVHTNRLTQRQATNIPLMKETIKTLISKVDDPPRVDWQEKSGDELKELIYQEIWNDFYKSEKLEWVDIVDKKNVFLYGLSIKKLNISKDGITTDVMDPYDILLDPLMNPLDIESARFVIHQNIFRSLRDILADDRYTDKGKRELKMWLSSDEGLIQSGRNREEFEKKRDRLVSMGVNASDFDRFPAGDVLVQLTEHYTRVWNGKEFEKRVIVYANDWVPLLDETLDSLIGLDKYPFVMWFEDPDTTDVYPDGVADLIRTPNKLLNVWFSQLTENRSLKNFQMHWYDASHEGYSPQTYDPAPGRMIPLPGNPKDVILPVEISGLDDTANVIEFVTKIVERGSGAIAIDKGQGETGQQTLGEVEILVGKAMERALAMQKFYRGSWYEFAKKWSDLIHANPPKKKSLYRTGKSGKLYEKVVYPSDWKSKAGYEPTVQSTSEQEQNEIKQIQKFGYVKSQYPNNPALSKIMQRRSLELLDLAPDELKEIQEAEEQMAQQMAQQAMMQQQPNPQQQAGQQFEEKILQGLAQ